MSDNKDARPTAAFHDELMIVAETVGEIRDRISKIETEFETQARPLTAAKDTQDAALVALNAALTGIKALNFHVLDNNLGEVSKRVESLSGELAKRATELAANIEKTRDELGRNATDLATKLARVSTERTELAKRTDAQRSELAATIAEVRTELANAQTELASRIQTAVTQFATPATLDPQGAWDAMTTYKKLAMVELNGTSYVSNIDDNRTKPGRGERSWTLVARRGAAGTGGGISDVTGIAGMGATGLQIAQAGTPEEVRTIVGVEDFDGATADDDGTAGRVPQPVAGDQNKYLRADGTWTTPSSVTAPAASQSTVDAGLVDDEYVSPLTLHGYVNPQFAARSRAGRIISNGVDANRRVQGTYGDAGNTAGLPGVYLINVPAIASAPTANIYLTARAASGTAAPVGQNHSFSAYVAQTSGDLVITARGATAATDHLTLTVAGYVGTYGAYPRRLSLNATEGNSATGMEVVLDGVTLSPTPTSGGTAVWQSSDLVATVALDGYNWPAGDMPTVLYGIGAMSTDEVAAWHTDGTLPAWMERPGSAVLLNTATVSVGANMASTTLSATGWEGNNQAGAYTRAEARPQNLIFAGRKVVVHFTTLNSLAGLGSGDYFELAIRSGGTNGSTVSATVSSNLGTVSGSALYITEPGDYIVEFTVLGDTSTTGRVQWGILAAESSTYAVSDIAVRAGGLLDKPVVLSALVTGDKLGQRSRLIVGGLPVPAEGNADGGTIYGSGTWAGTHEAKDIFGGTVFDSSMPCIVEAVTLAASASSSGTGPTFGNTNDPDQYVTAAAITGGTPKHFGTAALADVFNGGTAANDRNLVIDPDSANYTGTIKATVKFSRVNT